MDLTKKIINIAIAILAITVCFQIITVNNNQLFSYENEETTEYKTDIVSKLNKDENYAKYKLAMDDTAPNS